MTISQLLQPLLEQGVLGALCSVLIYLFVKMFQKVITVIDKNTEAFHKNSSAFNELKESINRNTEKGN